jgi:hypothetical protein
MAIFVLKNASVTINSVDLSAYVTSVTLDYKKDAVESTAMGASGHTYEGGLQSNTVTVSLNQDFAATKTEATIFPLVGTSTTVVVKADSGAVSATNPSYTVSSTYLEGSQPVAGAVGDLAAMQLTFTGGTLVKATS